MSFEVGRLVGCVSPAYRQAVRLPHEAGIVLSARRRDAQVLFFPSLRALWVPLAHLRPVETAEPPPALASLLVRIRALLDLVPAKNLEVAASEGGIQVKVVAGAVSLKELRQLEMAGARRLRVVPEGMSRLGIVYELKV